MSVIYCVDAITAASPDRLSALSEPRTAPLSQRHMGTVAKLGAVSAAATALAVLLSIDVESLTPKDGPCTFLADSRNSALHPYAPGAFGEADRHPEAHPILGVPTGKDGAANCDQVP
jgi:hypothetical protein